MTTVQKRDIREKRIWCWCMMQQAMQCGFQLPTTSHLWPYGASYRLIADCSIMQHHLETIEGAGAGQEKTEKSASGSAPDEPVCEAGTLMHQIWRYSWPPCWRRWNKSLRRFIESSWFPFPLSLARLPIQMNSSLPLTFHLHQANRCGSEKGSVNVTRHRLNGRWIPPILNSLAAIPLLSSLRDAPRRSEELETINIRYHHFRHGLGTTGGWNRI